MQQLSDADLQTIMTLLRGKKVSLDQANAISAANRQAWRNFSNDQKAQFAPGHIVEINFRGQKMHGIVRKVAAKNLMIELENGRTVRAAPTLVSHSK